MAQFFTLTPDTVNEFADIYSATIGRDMPSDIRTFDDYVLLDWTENGAPNDERDVETFPYGVYEKTKDYRWRLMD